MNVDVRVKILNRSLTIENELSSLLKAIIKVPKNETKTLGNQSSSLSFRTKVDLLYDLNRITTDEYNKLILFMEIRNQFIHNIDANSFIKVFVILGNSKRNKLLGYNDDFSDLKDVIKSKEDDEKILELSFDFLSIRLIEIILSIREQLVLDFENEKKQDDLKRINNISMDMLLYVEETIDEFGDIWANKLGESGLKSDFKEIMSSYIHQKTIEKLRNKYPELPELIK